MANMFMKLGKNKIKGGATSLYTGGDKTSKSGWFAIRSLSWRASRSVSMDIGNGMNRDSGMVAMSEITFTKEMDGASEVLLSRMYVPGKDGDTVDIIITKPDRSGQGAEVYLHLQLSNARIVDINLNIADGATPFECYALAYSKILLKHWNETAGGMLEAGGDVTYDLPTGKAESHADVETGGGGGATDAL
ncbi:Hcp family type VI secretion system effector [Endozoicomonas lisbonensis]|uniref:Type VI secretion system secreted protein Hcp n=1 Tax=Endozoicomonas lisbonensis TaxID=3120522 RepID=A0ABV2SFC4_9GAMM